MRPFPFIDWLVFLAIAGLLTLTSTLASNHCTFGFGGYQCNGWLSAIASFLWWFLIAGLALAGAVLLFALARSFSWVFSSKRQTHDRSVKGQLDE